MFTARLRSAGMHIGHHHQLGRGFVFSYSDPFHLFMFVPRRRCFCGQKRHAWNPGEAAFNGFGSSSNRLLVAWEVASAISLAGQKRCTEQKRKKWKASKVPSHRTLKSISAVVQRGLKMSRGYRDSQHTWSRHRYTRRLLPSFKALRSQGGHHENVLADVALLRYSYALGKCFQGLWNLVKKIASEPP